jgi:hypothetical protein
MVLDTLALSFNRQIVGIFYNEWYALLEELSLFQFDFHSKDILIRR